MATSNKNDRTCLAPAALQTLDALRRRIRWYVFLEGLASAVTCLGVCFWLSLGADWFFEPPVWIRVLLFCATIGVLLAILIRSIVCRAFARFSYGNMAIVLERRFPHLNDSLLTAVSFWGRARESLGCDEALYARVCGTAEERLAAAEVNKVFDFRPLSKTLLASVLLVISVLLFKAAHPNVVSVWAYRNLGFSMQPWPRMTRLVIDGFSGGIRKVARGSDVEILVRADRTMPRVPQIVEIRYREEGGGSGRAIMNRGGTAKVAKDRYQEYQYTRRNVLSSIRFDVYGGDDCIRDQR
ncbi:MAG: hypothetical protein ACWGMZ_03075, partial [Thermoguttaceae bacterium]